MGFGGILLLIIGVAALLVLLLVARENTAFYTRTDCSICGRPTGFKGNKRFKLRDGYMCELCLKAISQGNNIEPGPSLYSSVATSRIKEKIKKPSVPIFDDTSVTAVDTSVRCPKCGSTQISANKKGFSAGKAVVGAALTGGIGLAAGAIGKNKVEITCLNCGHRWAAGA